MYRTHAPFNCTLNNTSNCVLDKIPNKGFTCRFNSPSKNRDGGLLHWSGEDVRTRHILDLNSINLSSWPVIQLVRDERRCITGETTGTHIDKKSTFSSPCLDSISNNTLQVRAVDAMWTKITAVPRCLDFWTSFLTSVYLVAII